MNAVLRLIAAVSLVWAALLLGFKDHVVAADQLSPGARSFANGLGIAHVVLAYVFWHAARNPTAHRGVIYGGIMLLALKTANDLYEILVLLPASQAVFALGDLVLSVGLLVAILEALPRTLAAPGRADSAGHIE